VKGIFVPVKACVASMSKMNLIRQPRLAGEEFYAVTIQSDIAAQISG
jgi:hypothetical protein